MLLHINLNFFIMLFLSLDKGFQFIDSSFQLFFVLFYFLKCLSWYWFAYSFLHLFFKFLFKIIQLLFILRVNVRYNVLQFFFFLIILTFFILPFKEMYSLITIFAIDCYIMLCLLHAPSFIHYKTQPVIAVLFSFQLLQLLNCYVHTLFAH